MTFSKTYRPLAHKYVGTIQFMSGLLNLFPYDIAEKILYKYFFGIDKEKDDHEKAKGELLLRANHRLYKNIQDCYNFTGIPQTALSEAQFYEKNRSFLKHIIPELVAVMHDCNCCHRHQLNKPAFIKTVDSPEEHQFAVITKPIVFTKEVWGGGCSCNCRSASRNLARIWQRFARDENNLFMHQSRDLKLFCRPVYMPIQYGYHPEW